MNTITRRVLRTLILGASLSLTSSFSHAKQTSTLTNSFDDQHSVKIFNRVSAFELNNQRGEKVGLDNLYGHVWIANLMFTQCGDVCRLQTSVMNGLQTAIKKASFGKHVRFVSLSVDSEYDSVDVLSDYIKSGKLETSQWDFLTGQQSAIWNLANHGFKLPVSASKSNGKQTIQHSPQFILVDWEGRIRGHYDVFSQSGIDTLKSNLLTVLDERTAVPESVVKKDLADPRQQVQLASAKTSEVFTNFRFSDQRDQSGISFRHKIIDDVGISYKAVHYDHGNAIAIADVDLDGLHDIYFTTLSGTNELWRNLGNGKFEDITESAGLSVSDRIGMGASFADIDNDGDPDLYTTSVRVGNLLFENDGKGHFKDITESSGTAVKAHSSSATFFDYNRDGLLDIFVTNVGKYTYDETATTSIYSDRGQIMSDYEYYIGFKDAFAGHLKPERAEASVLFKNMGNNRFENVSKKTKLVDKAWTGEATVIDGNNDGWPDLYITSMQGNDEYYQNVEGQRFVRKSRELFPKTPWGAMGIRSFDYDNDGDMDIYVTDMHSDMRKDIGIPKEKLKAENDDPESFLQSGGNSIFGNAFYRNDGVSKDGSNTYSEISDQIGVENYWPWGPGSGDLNADGYEDLFVASSMAYPFRYSVNSVLLNNRGQNFIDSEYALGVEPRKNEVRTAPWFEIDCAGANKGHAGCLGSATPGRTVVWGAVGTRSSVIFDLDQDGDQDIVTLEFNQPPMVLISNLSEQKKINYLKVKLIGTESNKSGIGAVVRVFAGNDVYTKVQDGKSGYLAQSLYPLYFGLGDNKSVKKIEITWPSGKQQTISDKIKINTLLSIIETRK